MQIGGLLVKAGRTPRAIHIYRLTSPLEEIGNRTKHQGYWLDTDNSFNLTDGQIETFINSDIVVIGRPVTDGLASSIHMLNLLRSHGAKLVYETDDDLTGRYRDVSEGRGLTCVPFLDAVDALTVSTQPLKACLAEYTDKPIYVLPNHLHTRWWGEVAVNHQRKYSGFNVMLIGTAGHQDDWRPAAEAALEFVRRNGDANLLVVGHNPDYITEDDRVFLLPYVDYADYPTMLTEADIVLCAIDPNDRFNDSKSAVKAMEAWAGKRNLNGVYGGAAVVATDSLAYRGVVRDGVNGLLVKHTVADYYTALEQLKNNSYLMRKLQIRGHHDVCTKHNIATGYKLWLDAYKRIRRLT